MFGTRGGSRSDAWSYTSTQESDERVDPAVRSGLDRGSLVDPHG
jgi:hypothetical protein